MLPYLTSLVGGFYTDGQWSACTPCSTFSTCCIPPTTMWLLVELLAVYVGGFDAVLRRQVNMVFVSIHSPQPTQSSSLSAGWMTSQLATTYSGNYIHEGTYSVTSNSLCRGTTWRCSPVKSCISTGKIKQGAGSVTWNFCTLFSAWPRYVSA